MGEKLKTRLKILWNADFSESNSGYGNYGKNVLTRLYNTEKYEIREFANYARISDLQKKHPLWPTYANVPERNSPQEEKYKSAKQNEFGAARFDRICLDFLPDCVFTGTDDYMNFYMVQSPLRPFYNLSIMTTIDSAPIRTEFINNYTKIDHLLTYSKYGQKVIKESCHHNVNLGPVAGGGIDGEIFKPVLNKSAHRNFMGVDNDAIILGFVARNQPRKLYPELFQTFRLLLEEYKSRGLVSLAEKTYLLISCSWPDLTGWNLPDLILEHGLSGKILSTYICQNCRHSFVTFFQDSRIPCQKCGNIKATTPNGTLGMTQPQLVNIYNLMDAYYQCANCEGFGIPIVEAASCGIPVFVPDYSAMEDMKETIGAIPIKVERFSRDVNNTQYRALPDKKDFVDKFIKFIQQPISVRANKGFQGRVGAIKHYNWDKIAKVWEDHFDGIQLKGLQGKWDSPSLKYEPKTNPPPNLSNKDFVEWAIVNVLGKVDEVNSYFGSLCLRDLNNGFVQSKDQIRQFNHSDLLKRLGSIRENINNLDNARLNRSLLEKQDYIEYANRK